MTMRDTPPAQAVFRRREWADSVNERRLAAQIAQGKLVRVAPGAYVPAAVWRALTPMQKHAQRVWEAASRTRPGTVYSHFAAAAVHDIDILGVWPDVVDVTVDRANGGRSTGRLRRHTRALDGIELVPWGEHFITSPAQTVIDLAAALPYLQGVVIADRSLWARRRDGALTTVRELRHRLASFTGRGGVRASRVVEFASPLSDSVGESRSRVLIDMLGFPAPELQHEFVLPSGRRVRTDTFWPEFDHVGEFDGVGKFLDPELLKGRTPAQALIDEKDREDELRRVVRGLSRWRTPELDHPARLYDILLRAGLPTSRPRPGR